MTRWKASAIHLSLSILVLCTIAAILIWRWYPPALFQTVKADKLFMIIAIVDVIVGPLLTLVVYKQRKKSLKFDLTVITLMQVAAMGYGLHTVWASRPVYLVASVDRFQLVFANELDPGDLEAAPPGYRQLPLMGVETIGTSVPKDGAERMSIVVSAMSGKDIHLIPARYVSYESVARELLTRSIPAAELATLLPTADAATMNNSIQDSGKAATDLAAVPIDSVRGSATMLLDARTGAVLGPVAVDPWPALVSRKARQSL